MREDYQTDGLATGSLSDIFDTEPVPLTTFLYDSNYLGLGRQGIKLSPIQMDWVRHFEQVYSPETYIALVDQLGEEWAPVRFVNTIVGLWAKGCLAPYTPIYDAMTGRYVPLDEFAGGFVAGADDTGKVGTYLASEGWYEGTGDMYRVQFSTGGTEDVYAGHKYLSRPKVKRPDGSYYYSKTQPQWTKLEDLQVGSLIAISSKLPEPMALLECSDEQVEMLGIYLGDGSYTKKCQPNITIGKESTMLKQRVLELAEHFGDVTRTAVRQLDECQWVYFQGGKESTVRTFLDEDGLRDKKAADKAVPEKYYSLSTRQCALLLSRLIDTDGHVYSNFKTGRGASSEIGFCSKSKQLALDVQHLFRRIGVLARFRKRKTKYKGEYRTYWCVEVTQTQEILKAYEQLTLLDKQTRFDDIVSHIKKTKQYSFTTHGDLRWVRITNIEPIGEGPYWTPTVQTVHNYITANGTVNLNSGKDLCARLGIARVADLALNLKSPQNYYGIPDTDEIQMLNIAVSAPQAHTAFFRPLKNALAKSPRFQDQFRGDTPTNNAKSILLKKNLELISGHSQAESQEGLNLLAGIADEIGAFKTEAEIVSQAGRVSSQSAEYILDMMRSSASTRFPKNYKIGIISYPRYESDAIMKATAEGKQDNEKYKDKSTYYVSGPYATWDVNPRVTKEDFAREYEEDPEYAKAKFECIPPKSSERFIRSDSIIMSSFHRMEEPAVEIEYYWGLPKYSPNPNIDPVEGWQVEFHISPLLQPMEGAVYAMHGDIALTQDRAGIAMAHVAQMRTTERGYTIDPRPVVKVDFITAFEAALGAMHNFEPQPREIKISWYRQLVYELIAKGFDIARVTFDGYQSQDMIQQFTDMGIESEVMSLDRTTKVYDEFKATLYDGRIDAPFHERCILELQSLSRVNRKIDHPPGGSKDYIDATAGAAYNAILMGGHEGDTPTAIELTWHNALGVDAGMSVNYGLPYTDISLSPSDYHL